MKLAIKNNKIAATEVALKAMTAMADQTIALRTDLIKGYIYFAAPSSKTREGAIIPDDGNANTGAWLLDSTLPVFVVPNSYDFGTNLATELDFNTYAPLRWDLGEYSPTPSDINQLVETIGYIKAREYLRISDEYRTAPLIKSVVGGAISISTSITLHIIGANFDNKTWVSIPNWAGSIDSVTVLDSGNMLLTITSDATIADYSIVLYNGGTSSSEWSPDVGQNAIKVVNIPTGAQKRVLESGEVGDVYTGTAFAKTERSGYLAAKAFDSNMGTRHYCQDGQAVNHFVGMLFGANDTLIEVVKVRGVDKTDSFRLEVSDDTTNGTDGTWLDCGTYNFRNQNVPIPSSVGAVGKAFRVLWLNPVGQRTGAKELIVYARQ